TDYEAILNEGRKLAQLGEQVYVKVPMIPDGIKAVKQFSAEGIKTNVTLVFSPVQALLAAKAGASLVSPFVGRLHDSGQDGTFLIEQIRQIYDNYGYETEILVASDRTVMDTVNAALIGADIITLKYDNLRKMFSHPLTDQGLEKFLEDWRNSGQESLV
ncbi:MAG: transaldolase family protein, partial [Candidatus Dojkabacteria bacterium]